jgi:hypothetical protein
MKTTNSKRDLGEQIEQLVEEHIAASRRTAQEALERAFGRASARTAPPTTQRLRAKGKKRPSSDIATLGERFYRAVSARPGESMMVLAVELGASARELHRSVSLLKRAGRVRAVGSRALTRYFPMVNGSDAT